MNNASRKAWIFDVDGVITSLETRKVEHPEILVHIANKLREGNPVGIITGRDLPKLKQAVLERIEEKDNINLLNVQAEFGGISVTYKNAVGFESVDKTYALPQNLSEKIKYILDNEFSDIVFDPGKITHFTAELKPEFGPDDFKDRKSVLAEKIKKVVRDFGLENEVEVHLDSLAVNVKNKKLNKHLATQKFLDWLKSKKIEPDFYYVFGDSKSDLQIGEELHENNKKLKFIYTGEDNLEKMSFEIEKIGKFDSGTLEYLQNN